jgi:hypothetical protein
MFWDWALIACSVCVGTFLTGLAWRGFVRPRSWGRNIRLCVRTVSGGLAASLAVCVTPSARGCGMTAACTANLKQIQGAVATWAADNQKGGSAVPREDELFGVESYIKAKPACPAGGVYWWGGADDKPTCSIKGHGIDAPLPARRSMWFEDMMTALISLGGPVLIGVVVIVELGGRRRRLVSRG